MTPPSVRLKQYIAMRRNLGFEISFTERVLRKLAEFADRERADHITVELFLHWKEHYGSANNYTWGHRLSMVRIFGGWLQGFDPRTEVPPAGVITGRPRRGRPYIYTEDQIGAIVTEAGRLRVKEPLGLDEEDVDLKQAVLTIGRAKNRKSRLRRQLTRLQGLDLDASIVDKARVF